MVISLVKNCMVCVHVDKTRQCSVLKNIKSMWYVVHRLYCLTISSIFPKHTIHVKALKLKRHNLVIIIVQNCYLDIHSHLRLPWH